MKTRVCIGLLATVVLATAPARADDKKACLDAVSKGQTLRNTHKLVEAREQFRVCAAARCPAVVQGDCANWLADVDKTLPTIVVTAKSGAGADLVDVTVTVDGQPLLSKLDGQALPMNPGTYAFHFEEADGTKVDQQVVVNEGVKNQVVAAVLGPVPAPATGVPDSTSTSPGSSPWKTVGWVLGGVGVAGLGLGTVFGIVAIGDNSSAHCNANNQCQAGPLSSARSAALVSNIGFIAGGVLLGAGAALVLFGPSGSEPPAASVAIAPAVGPDGAGVALGGSW